MTELELTFKEFMNSTDAFLESTLNNINKAIEETDTENLYAVCSVLVDQNETLDNSINTFKELISMVRECKSTINSLDLFLYQIDLEVTISALKNFVVAIVKEDFSEDIDTMKNRLNTAYNNYLKAKKKLF
ncbi:hypothetical protein ACQPUY_15520 [Clostridium nigeriense]|uniref:hypothetical protein n=1 Tax=Clostridium nigeriense TaxID=1805470 RepID=UPI003D32B6DF